MVPRKMPEGRRGARHARSAGRWLRGVQASVAEEAARRRAKARRERGAACLCQLACLLLASRQRDCLPTGRRSTGATAAALLCLKPKRGRLVGGLDSPQAMPTSRAVAAIRQLLVLVLARSGRWEVGLALGGELSLAGHGFRHLGTVASARFSSPGRAAVGLDLCDGAALASLLHGPAFHDGRGEAGACRPRSRWSDAARAVAPCPAPSCTAEKGNFSGTSPGQAGPVRAGTQRSLDRSPLPSHLSPRHPCVGRCVALPPATLARAPPMTCRAGAAPAISRAWPRADPSLWHALAILRGNTHVAKWRPSPPA